ncbi:MAG: poly-beta-1,6 N-acetyl-D-glucosamine export porin PgaA [Pseudomonas sp.]
MTDLLNNVAGRRVVACCFSLGMSLGSSLVWADQSYLHLIERARMGEQQPALDYLRQLPAPTARQQLDLLLIASWAGEDEEVLRLYQGNTTVYSKNADAVAAMARAHRNRGEWAQAINGFHQARALAPERADLLQAQLMTTADMGQTPAAIKRARLWTQQSPNQLEARLALGYALMHDGQQHASLAEYDRAWKLAPERRDVLREYLFALQRAGLPVLALGIAEQHPELLGEAELRTMRADALAERVRLSDTSSRSESERFVVADRALAQADAMMQEWGASPDAQADVIRVRVDRMGALHARVDMQSVVDEYHALKAMQVALPPYALRWVASAMLYLRQPELSAELYREVIAASNERDQSWQSDHQSLYYALIESEELEEANQISNTLVEAQPPRLYPLGVPGGRPNNNWLDSQTLAANNALYRDDLPTAQRAFEQLSDAAPGNVSLRTSRASVYGARGWPRRAEEQLKIAESTAPKTLEVQASQATNALALQEWRQVDLLADDLVERFPENLRAQRVDRLRDVHHMAELRISGYRGRSSDDSVSGDDDFGLDTVVYSSPFKDDWRAFAGAGMGRGEFLEGDAEHDWLRAGLEHRIRNHTLEAELSSHEFGFGRRMGARLGGVHDINDIWQYGWSAELLSASTPLRALNSNIDADSLSVYARWRESERRAVSLSIMPMSFSDGNERLSLVLDGSQRLYTAPRMTLDAGLALATSRNSQGGEGPYFNPEADASAMSTLNLSHIMHRRYETVWSQDLQFGLGYYDQRDFAGGGMAMLGYGQRLRMNDVFDAGFLLSALSRPYDGDREQEYRLVLDLNFRFEGL